MQKEQFIELVTKYLSNEASFKEKEILSELLKKDEYNNLFVWISDNWQNYDAKQNNYDFDLDRGLDKLAKKIKKYEPEFKWEEKRVSRSHQRTIFYKAASIAVFIILTISTIYWLGNSNNKNEDITFNEKITLAGQKSILTLLDGTKVTLNANSRLKYPLHFGKFSREVYLVGEAYFEVVHNTKKPFIVHTGEISTKVLGTKFNVSAFPNENELKISLVEGKVLVSNSNKNLKEFNLKPHQQYVYNISKTESIVRNFNVLKEIGWKDNKFIFDNEPLENVLVKLERAFGVQLELDFPLKKQYKIKANFNKESLWTIVEAIKYATNLNYKVAFENNKTKKIIFSKKKELQHY